MRIVYFRFRYQLCSNLCWSYLYSYYIIRIADDTHIFPTNCVSSHSFYAMILFIIILKSIGLWESLYRIPYNILIDLVVPYMSWIRFINDFSTLFSSRNASIFDTWIMSKACRFLAYLCQGSVLFFRNLVWASSSKSDIL